MKHQKRLIDWLTIIRSMGTNPATLNAMQKIYGDPENILKELPRLIKHSKSKKMRTVKIKSRNEIEQEIEKVHKANATLITFEDNLYPTYLKYIKSAPSVLTMKGNLDLLKNLKLTLAIVGSRNASANGILIAKRISEALSKNKVVIISGLAAGIDTAAHSVVYKKYPSIAVIAGGIDTVYPKQNKALQSAIEEDGIVITEAPFGTPPKMNLFPKRNRIISGLSLGVLVVEAAQKSGSLITANNALSQGREVFAIPGSPLDPRHSGSLSLLKDGATLVSSAEDILDSIKSNSILKFQHSLFEPNETFFPQSIDSTQSFKKMLSEYLDFIPNKVQPFISDIRKQNSNYSLIDILFEIENNS